MPSVALVPALSLIAGSACAQVLTRALPGPRIFDALLVAAVASVVLAARFDRPRLLVCSVGAGFGLGGAALAQHAWTLALRPPLRLAWEAEARRVAATARSDADPLDGTVFAIVIGVLRADASVRADGVGLNLAVTRVRFDNDRSRAALSERETGGARALEGVSGDDSFAAAAGGVWVSIGGQVAPALVETWRAGRTLRLPVQLRRPSRHLNRGVPDEERDFARRGTTLVGSAKSGLLVDVIEPGTWWAEQTARIRAHVRRVMAKHVGRIDPVASGLATAILIGDRAGLSLDVQRTLQEAGTYHVVAISGGNVALLAAATLAVFRWGGALGRAAMLVAVAGFLLFGSIVEGGASVDRAVTMAVLSFLARAADHRIDVRHGLAVAAAFLVAVDPLVSADPGFLLSCAATGGIVAGLPVVVSRAWPRLVAVPAALVAASLAAELATLPMVARLFGRVTLAGLVLNLLAVPLMAATQCLGFAVVVLAPVSRVGADLAGTLTTRCAQGLVESGALVEWAPGLARRVAQPSGPIVAVYYLGIAAMVVAWRSRSGVTSRMGARARSVAGVGVGLSAGALLWMVVQPWAALVAKGDGRLHVTFFDVGQGDAALVRFPHGATMLVDAGGTLSGTYDVGDRVVGPALRALGVLALDTLVLTHADVDHAGGLMTVMREFRPFELWEGVPVAALPLRQSLRAQALRRGVRWVNVQQGDAISLDDVQLWVHHPPLADWERQATRNDDSVVIELAWRDVSIVLAGDVGRDAEEMLAPRFKPALLRVLKVPHHGSRTSSTTPFVTALAPHVAVFSTGRGNVFGHPVPSVVARYRDLGSAIFRTDQDGEVELSTDGRQVTIRTFTGRTLDVGSSPVTRPRAASLPPTPPRARPN